MDQDGVYRFTSVLPGIYSLRASRAGFKQYEISRVPVTADKTTGECPLETAQRGSEHHFIEQPDGDKYIYGSALAAFEFL